MQQLVFKPSANGVHSIRPDHDFVLSGIDKTKAQCLALIDVGAALDRPEFDGIRIPFVSYSTVDSNTFHLKPSEENLWVQGGADILEHAEPFENGAAQFDAITPHGTAELFVDEDGDVFDLCASGVWFRMGDQPKETAPHPGGEYVFVGQMETYYNKGTVYVFYHPIQGDVVLQCQFS